MGRVSVGSTSNTEQQKIFKGVWHRAGTPAEMAIGGLLEVGENQILLEVYSGFEIDDSYDPFPEDIFGESDGQKITLVGARLFSSQSVLKDGFKFTNQKWSTRQVIVGAHTPNAGEVEYSHFEFETLQLAYWLNQSTWQSSVNPAALKTIELVDPQDIEINLENEVVSVITWSHRVSMKPLEYSVDISPRVKISFSRPITLLQFYKNYLKPFLHLTSFATGAPDQLSSLHVNTSSEASAFKTGNMEILLSGLGSSSRASEQTYASMNILRFEEIQTNIEIFMNRWLELCNSESDILLEFFSLAALDTYSLNESFLQIIRCLESWHAVKYPESKIFTEDEFHLVQKAIKTLSDINLQNRAATKMNNFPFLAQRLQELIDASPGEISAALKSRIPDYLARTTSTRNRLTHLGKKGKVLESNEIQYIIRVFQLVFNAQLLKALDFSDGDVSNMLKRTFEWKQLIPQVAPFE